VGNGTRARITGNGHRKPMGMVLIVPELLAHEVYTIGTFKKQG